MEHDERLRLQTLPIAEFDAAGKLLHKTRALGSDHGGRAEKMIFDVRIARPRKIEQMATNRAASFAPLPAGAGRAHAFAGKQLSALRARLLTERTQRFLTLLSPLRNMPKFLPQTFLADERNASFACLLLLLGQCHLPQSLSVCFLLVSFFLHTPRSLKENDVAFFPRKGEFLHHLETCKGVEAREYRHLHERDLVSPGGHRGMEQELFAFDANRLDVRGDAFADDFRPTREDEALLIGAFNLLAQRMDAFWYHLIDFFHAGIATIGAFHGLPFPKVRILLDTI